MKRPTAAAAVVVAAMIAIALTTVPCPTAAVRKRETITVTRAFFQESEHITVI
jgi:hypothetical protein